MIDREKWPEHLRPYSGRDALLAYIREAWPLFFGGDEPVVVELYHDLGHHVLRRGTWRLELTDESQFPPAASTDSGEEA